VIATLLTAAALMLPPVPGATNPDVTQATLGKTACVPGWSATIRPPVSYTAALKQTQMMALGLPGTPADYQEDHLISLSLGGAPRSVLNLWPQPWRQASRDDRVELALHRAICNGAVLLRDAQRLEVAYKRVFG
jgi:hypothetical protein